MKGVGLLNRLEKKMGRFALPNLTLYLILGQVLFFIACSARRELMERMLFVPALFLAGEYWRALTFLFIPPTMSPIWLFFALYLFYLMGTALESHWGAFRYNLYLLIAYIASIGGAFVNPLGAATNAYIGGSIFLAFAFLHPDFVLQLFFILPVKIKWLALLTWIGYFISFITGDWQERVLILASIANFLLFFGRDMFLRVRYGAKAMKRQIQDAAEKENPIHCCVVCGITEKSNPQMEFRYCAKCSSTPCYCMDHLSTHEHS